MLPMFASQGGGSVKGFGRSFGKEIFIPFTQDFNYTGNIQSITVPYTGTYKLEVWGAQGGGNIQYFGPGGNGGYASGNKVLNQGTALYIVIGQQGFQSFSSRSFNGGGKGNPGTGYGDGFTGGGATHIATRTGELSSLASFQSDVLIVAGGGGAGAGGCGYTQYVATGGAGGGLNGGNGTDSNNEPSYRPGGTGGTQTTGGTSQNASENSAFGYGASSTTATGDCIQGGGGGGGWYGGGAGATAGGGGGGGSGYIGNVFSGTMSTGIRTGNGFARITRLDI